MMHYTRSVAAHRLRRSSVLLLLASSMATILSTSPAARANARTAPPRDQPAETAAAFTPDDAWDDRFGAPGITCCVGFSDVATVAQVAGNDVYVGGNFDSVGNLDGTVGVARWDGRRWHALGIGLQREDSDGDVYDLAVSGDDVYVVGNFDKAGNVPALNIARWNIPTQTWNAVGKDGPRDAYNDLSAPDAITVAGGQVFVGGEFRSIDGVDAAGIAVWDGTKWSPLAGGIVDTNDDKGDVSAILVRGNQVFVGGFFDLAVNPNGVDDANAKNIAVWNRSTGRWAALDAGVSARVNALADDGTALYVGGAFTNAGGSMVNAVARWDGTAWSALGSGVNDVVYGLSLTNGTLYVAGSFADAGGVANTDSLAAWNGTQWSSLRTDQLFNDPAEQYINTAVVQASGAVFAAGSFNDSGQPLFRGTAIWDGTRWSGTGQGLTDGYVNPGDGYAVAVNSQGQAFVGGAFSELGGLPFRNLAMWDGNAWRDVGGGVDGSVSAMLIRGDDLYIGGTFITVGDGVAAVNIAKWNMSTQTWSAVGNGLPAGFVNDLVFVGDTLYAGGGGFPSQTECCLWKFDGTTWSPFSQRFLTHYFNSGSAFGPDTRVYALATDGERLYVGGVFIDIEARDSGAVTYANDIFVYEPATDTVRVFGGGQLNDGTGVDKNSGYASVSAIALANGALYIGGDFENVQKVAAVNIARFDANGWSALGTGVLGEDASVSTFVVNGSDLYVGGAFEVAGQQAFNIARWNTSSQHWSALGCGIVRYDDTLSASRVAALTVQPPGLPNAGLYVTGGFLEAGCKPAESFAIWHDFGAGPLSPQAYLPLMSR